MKKDQKKKLIARTLKDVVAHRDRLRKLNDYPPLNPLDETEIKLRQIIRESDLDEE
jgi:hypothetical protein